MWDGPAAASLTAKNPAISGQFPWLSPAGGRPVFQALVAPVQSTRLNQSPES